MAVTLIGGSGPEYPRTEPAVIVERKALWSDEWVIDPELEAVRASDHTGHDIGTCVLRRRYGPAVADPPPAAFAARLAKSIRGHWVRLRLAGAGDAEAEGGVQTIWTGRIQAESRAIQGASGGDRGIETWVAYSALDILRKVRIHSSRWAEVVDPLGWVPGVNFWGTGDIEGGNRSAIKVAVPGGGQTYAYDRPRDDDASPYYWTNHDYLEYILKRFVQQTDGPVWTIGGATELIEDLTLSIPLRGGESALQILDRMVPARYGCGYRIAPTAAGFEVRVFSLSAHSAEFFGASMPLNPDGIVVDAPASHDLFDCQVEISNTQLYDGIRVVGERRKVIGSLIGPGLAGTDIRGLWTTALETAYKAGTGVPADDQKKQDLARATERFRRVYQLFGATATWNPPSPLLDKYGQVATGTAAQQYVIRRTLPYLMLREGWDYTQDPPVNNNLAAVEADFLPPLVLVKFTNLPGTPWGRIDKISQVMSDAVMKMQNASVRGLDHEWGVLIESTPNHALADNHFAGANPTGFDPATDGVDYEDMVITLAVEQDHHLELAFDLPEGFRAGDGSVMVVRERGAEFWYLAPNTYVDVDIDGTLLQSPSTGIVLRNDSTRLARVAAGAVARYCTERARARIRKRRLEAWGELLGHILAVVEDAEHTEKIYSPVTSVEWMFEGTRETVISTGFAR